MDKNVIRQRRTFDDNIVELADIRYKKIHFMLKKLPRGRILEIGCSDGEFLRLMKNEGWQVKGLEISEKSTQKAIDKGVDVSVHNANEDLPLVDNSFDVIVAGEIIEHLFEDLDFVMIAVNQIAPDKGVEDVINAFALIKKEIKNAKLIFVGSGKLEPGMHELVNKHNLKNDFFHLKGISEQELFNCYFSSDLFVNAQSQQNWSMSVQEAMACGLPIVSFENIVLNEHNKTGIVVKDRTPKGIKEGILKIYHGDKGKMKKRALELTNEYSWENIVKTAIKEYKKLLKE